MNTTQRAGFVITGLAVLGLAIAAPAFATQEKPPQAPPQAQQQPRAPQPITGDLVRVDTDAKMLTVKTETAEVQFAYNDNTKITGAKDAAGLATLKEGRVTVHFTENADTKAKLATQIIVEPRK